MAGAGNAGLQVIFEDEPITERGGQEQLARGKLRFITWKLRYDPTVPTWDRNQEWKSLTGALEVHRRVEALCPKIAADVLKADLKSGRPRWDFFYEYNPAGVLVEIWVKSLNPR